MSEKDIIKGNELIAEFMGIDKGYSFGWIPNINEMSDGFYNFICSKMRRKTWYVKELKFNSSWNWLMPVVEKVEFESAHFVEIKGNTATVHNIDLTYSCDAVAATKIEAVWLACVAFIEWYNRNKLIKNNGKNF